MKKILLLIALSIILTGCSHQFNNNQTENKITTKPTLEQKSKCAKDGQNYFEKQKAENPSVNYVEPLFVFNTDLNTCLILLNWFDFDYKYQTKEILDIYTNNSKVSYMVSIKGEEVYGSKFLFDELEKIIINPYK
ncbi:MAG: hypothetical protein CMI53_04020 [Parcubacteria group bacterium]|nr:hypothetical protein [Parcubacteria group bacterium]|tara:strand:+ start:84 stop:488 length:405 start_codon:yes stop_codon:yes gene_type:complete